MCKYGDNTPFLILFSFQLVIIPRNISYTLRFATQLSFPLQAGQKFLPEEYYFLTNNFYTTNFSLLRRARKEKRYPSHTITRKNIIIIPSIIILIE